MISNLETFKLNCKWISEINQAPLPRNLHSEKKKKVPHNQIVNSCIQHSDHKKNNKDFLHPTALLRLIPTVSCHDATAPVKDKVAIILLPVSSPLILNLRFFISKRTSQCLRVSLLHLPRWGNSHREEEPHCEAQTSDWLQCILVGCPVWLQTANFSQDLWVTYLRGLGGKFTNSCSQYIVTALTKEQTGFSSFHVNCGAAAIPQYLLLCKDCLKWDFAF